MFNKKQLKRISEDIFWIRESNKIYNNRIKVLEDKVKLLEQRLDISSRPFIKSDPLQFTYFVGKQLLKYFKLEIVEEEVEDKNHIAPKRTIYR